VGAPDLTLEEFDAIAARAEKEGTLLDPASALAAIKEVSYGGSDVNNDAKEYWQGINAEVAGWQDERLPSMEMLRIMQQNGDATEGIGLAIWAVALWGSDNDKIQLRQALSSYRLKTIPTSFGDTVKIKRYPGFAKRFFKRWYHRSCQLADEIKAAADRMLAIVERYRELCGLREQARDNLTTVDEVNSNDEYEAKHPWQTGGKGYQDALVRARYGDCARLNYGEYLNLLWHIGEVGGL